MPMSKEEMKAFVQRVRSNLKVTKVVATRSVKGRMGDTFIGFSAAWNSVQEDGGQNLMAVGSEADESNTLTGMTLQESVVAAAVLAREVDITAHNHALAGGNMSAEFHSRAIKAIKANYNQIILSAMNGTDPNSNAEESNGHSNPPVSAVPKP